MRAEELRSLPEAPTGDPAIEALWWAAHGDWNRAHECAQAGEGGPADWVHAYLHRVEGDPANARYWYARARKPESRVPLEAEWEEIARDLLARAGPASDLTRREA
jgi:hypothetical protein